MPLLTALPCISALELSPMPVNWQGLPTAFLNFGELELIVALIRSANHATVVEIGLAQGRTARAVLNELPDVRRYVGIDTEPDYLPSLASQRHERDARPGHLAMKDPRFEVWLRPRGSLDLVMDDFPPVDAVFIDGDHSSEVVRHDSELARDIVAPGGIIIWHDAGNDSVEVRRVLERDRWLGHDIRQVLHTWLAFERR
jgi:predicted O-methyltransferase YrrM